MRIGLFCFLLFFFLRVPFVQAQADYEALFQKIFNTKPVKEVYSYEVILIVDYNEDEAIPVQLTTSTYGDFYKLKWVSFLKGLRGHQLEEGIKKVEIWVDTEGYIDLNLLKPLGYTFKLDKKRSRLIVETPAQFRKKIVIRINPPFIQNKYGVLSPSSLTSYLNLSLSEYYDHDSGTDFSPMTMTMTHVVFVNGFALKTAGSALSGDPNPFELDTSQLVYQNARSREQYAAGLLTPPLVAFMPDRSLLGAGFSRIYSDWPDQVPVDQTPFSTDLAQTSKVEIFRNNIFLTAYQLPAGPVDFTDFPLQLGNNVFEIKVTNLETNTTETFSFSRVYDNNFLPEGMSETSVASGVPFAHENRAITIDDHTPVISSFYRQSLTKDMQLTGYTDVQNDQYLIGGESFHLIPIGRLKLGAATLILPDQTGWAASLSYTPFFSALSGVTLIYEDAVFGASQSGVNAGKVSLSQANSYLINGTPVNTSCYYSFASDSGVSGYGGSLGTEYSFSRTSRMTFQTALQKSGENTVYSFSSGLNNRFWGNAQLNTFLKWSAYSVDQSNRLSIDCVVLIPFQDVHEVTVRSAMSNTSTATLGLDYRFDPRIDGFYTMLHSDLSQDSTQFAGELYKEDRLSQFKARVNYGFSPGSRTEGQSVEVSTPRGRALFNFNETKPDAEGISRASSMTFETALVYADGNFALARPVQGSFVMLYPDDSIKGSTIFLKNGNSLVDSWGPAVINVSPYKTNVIEIGLNNVPSGFDLSQKRFQVETLPDSGMAIKLGSNRNVMIMGRLIDKNTHRPFVFRTFILSAVDQPDWKRRLILTGENGDFSEKGLAPGKYLIEVKGQYPIEFVIENKFLGIWKLGDLEVGGVDTKDEK